MAALYTLKCRPSALVRYNPGQRFILVVVVPARAGDHRYIPLTGLLQQPVGRELHTGAENRRPQGIFGPVNGLRLVGYGLVGKRDD